MSILIPIDWRLAVLILWFQIVQKLYHCCIYIRNQREVSALCYGRDTSCTWYFFEILTLTHRHDGLDRLNKEHHRDHHREDLHTIPTHVNHNGIHWNTFRRSHGNIPRPFDLEFDVVVVLSCWSCRFLK